MLDIPSDPKKIRARIKSYERRLNKEKQMHGSYDDGAGKRYFLGPLYLVMGDLDGALRSYEWFAREFPNDIGEESHLLCGALAFHRAGRHLQAQEKLRSAMFQNRLLLPVFLGVGIEEVLVSAEDDDYLRMCVDEMPEEFLALWTDAERKWARDVYECDVFTAARRRYVEIERALVDLPRGPERSNLVREMSRLKWGREPRW